MEITEKEKSEVLAKANEYLKWEKSEVFRKEVEDAIAKNDYDDLYDRFYTALAFGTAGMRGVIGGIICREFPFILDTEVLQIKRNENYEEKHKEKTNFAERYKEELSRKRRENQDSIFL